MKKRVRYYTFLLLITPICFELALRILGYSAYHQVQYSLESSPKMCLTASNTRGFSLGEGTFQVSMNGAPKYTATHRAGKRITRKHELADSLDKIFVMGCSLTYGMGVDDSVSFPYQIQSHFKNYDVQNFGVPGYGNVQSLLQLEAELSNGNIPAIVVLNFCDFHHERNSLTPRFRNSLVMGFQRSNDEAAKALQKSKFPYVGNGIIQFASYANLYSNWSERETFAGVNYLQTMQDEHLTPSKEDLEKNTELILFQMQKLCKKKGIPFIVTGLTRNTSTRRFLSYLTKGGINTYNISLDLTKKKYNQLPYDTHPNACAHDHFAKKIIPIIENTLSSRSLAN